MQVNSVLPEHWSGHGGRCLLPKASLVTNGSKLQGKCQQRGEWWDRVMGNSPARSGGHSQGGMTDSRTASFQSSGGFYSPGDQSSAGVGGGGKQEEKGQALRSGWQEPKSDGKQSGSLPGVNEETHVSPQTLSTDKGRHRICFRRSKGN